MKRDAWEGSVSGTCETACSNSTPSRARREAAGGLERRAVGGEVVASQRVDEITTTLASAKRAPFTGAYSGVLTPPGSGLAGGAAAGGFMTGFDRRAR